MNKYGIIVIGYDRLDSLKRVLDSLNNAFYNEKVDLIISLDKSNVLEVYEFANNFNWSFGEKKVILSEEKLGLRKHVLKCGNYINKFKFDAIIVLEDDLYVSPDFFNYSKQAIEFYKDEDIIAGISLYKHLLNIDADIPFSPVLTNSDSFFMQYAQSWGQVWTKKQWNSFYEWYSNEEFKSLDLKNVPENIKEWPESSWLKYYIQYCIDKDKFFVYPYKALSTNFADAGTHYKNNTNKMQIPIVYDCKKIYNFVRIDESIAVYDAFFENLKICDYLNLDKNEVDINLYGRKKHLNKRYLLTMENLGYKIMKSYGLQMRPHEMNVILNIDGICIKLYDTTKKSYGNLKLNNIYIEKWNYYSRGIVLLKQKLVKLILNEFILKIKFLYSKFKNRKFK